jgi:hypothetical protein
VVRVGARVGFLTEEARGNGPDAGKREGEYTLAPCVQIGSFQAPDCEDELMSWYGDWRIPALSKLLSCIGIRKLVSASAWAKHVVLYEFISLEARAENLPKLATLYASYLKLLRLRPAAGRITKTTEWAAWADAEHRAWRTILRADPLLPKSLLPANYTGRIAWHARQESLAACAKVVATEVIRD